MWFNNLVFLVWVIILNSELYVLLYILLSLYGLAKIIF